MIRLSTHPLMYVYRKKKKKLLRAGGQESQQAQDGQRRHSDSLRTRHVQGLVLKVPVFIQPRRVGFRVRAWFFVCVQM